MTNTLRSAYGAFEDWLLRAALPLWAGRGCDREWGGFFEQINDQGNVIEGPRRPRLVARQIYVFAQAERIGWDGDGHALVDHGLDFLLRHQLLPDGLARLSVQPGRAADGFDLYDQAFVLFAFAEAARAGVRPDEMLERARCLLNALQRYRHPQIGFQEALPPTTPLRSNPHMHLFEAALALAEAGEVQAAPRLADEIGALCLDHLIVRDTGAVHEVFDANWRTLTDPTLTQIEPGHQHEWGWIMLRWQGAKCPAVAVAANRMIDLAELHGTSSEGLAINGLAADLTPRDRRHRLWPQTERIKAHVERMRRASTPAERRCAEALVVEALRGLLRFFEHPVSGAWWEHLDASGAPVNEPARASSLYHIVGAFMALRAYLFHVDSADTFNKKEAM